MTIHEYEEKQAGILTGLREAVSKYNIAIAEKRYDDASELAESMEEDVGRYNDISRFICYDHCAKAEDPMREACLTLHYNVIAVKDTLVGEDIKIPMRVILGDPDSDSEPKYKQIDLLKLHKFVKERPAEYGGKKGIGHESNWYIQAERMNMLFALDCAVTLGKGPEFIKEMEECYAISNAAKSIDFSAKNPKAGSPVSNTAMLKAVSAVVTAMLGEEEGNKVLSHDVKFLKICSAKKSKRELAIACANHRFFRTYLMEVCYRVLTSSVYDLEYKKIKAK